MRYRGFKLTLQRGGAVIVEGKTLDGRPPLSPSPRGRCKRARALAYIGHVAREQATNQWTFWPSSKLADAFRVLRAPASSRYPFRSWAAMVLFNLAERAGFLAHMRPLED